MIRRSNDRLRMLDEMGEQRQLKLQQDLQRLEAEKEAERLRQQRLTAKRLDFGGIGDRQGSSLGAADSYQMQPRPARSPQRSPLLGDMNSHASQNRKSVQIMAQLSK